MQKRKNTVEQKQQDKIIDAAEPEIMARLTDHYNALSALAQETDGVTVLKKHLQTYTRRNTADFFIHKDLKQFLTRRTGCLYQKRSYPTVRLNFHKC